VQFELETDNVQPVYRIEENSVEYDLTKDSREGIYMWIYMWLWICVYLFIYKYVNVWIFMWICIWEKNVNVYV
jgi:hypothetical protein